MTPKPSGKSILVVDDDEQVRKMIAHALQLDGHSVLCATGLEGILRALQLRQFDLVITDVIMPEIDGTEVIKLVKKHQPGVPFIAISGGGSHMSRHLTLQLTSEMGAFGCLAKPLKLADLLQTVDRALAADDTGPIKG